MAFDFNEVDDENVINLIERPQEEYVKSPRYRSIHSRRTRQELSRSKSAYKSLGPVQTTLIDPHNFLLKRSGQRSAPPASRHVHYRRPNYQHKLPEWKPIKVYLPPIGQLPPLPKDPMTGKKACFPKKNIDIARSLRPKCVKPRFVDTRRGDVQDLIASGLQPVYIYKKNFGKVPEKLKRKVLTQRKDKEIIGEKEFSDDFLGIKKPLCRYVTEDEREDLLQKLKFKWTETMKEYQCLPFIIDSVPKIKRKTRLEDKLKKLEKDIGLIENHRYIYVYDD